MEKQALPKSWQKYHPETFQEQYVSHLHSTIQKRAHSHNCFCFERDWCEMTDAWFAVILYCSCPEPWGGEGSGVSGVAEKETQNSVC